MEVLSKQSQDGEPAMSLQEYLSEVVDGALGEGMEAAGAADWHLHTSLIGSLKRLYQVEDLPDEVTSNVLFHLGRLADMADSALDRVGASTGWSACASEGEACKCQGVVRFGVDGAWSAPAPSSNTTECSTERFGDPRPHMSKRCECLPSKPDTSDLLRAHLLTLRASLSEVFCGPTDDAGAASGSSRRGSPCRQAEPERGNPRG